MFKIRVLKKEDNRNNFSCGEIELDYFFKRFAGQNQFKHYIGITYIATNNQNIFGFINVSSGSLSREALPLSLGKRLPSYPLPILRVTRVGVDINYQKIGVGKALIVSMFELAIEQKEKVGCIGVVVDAKTDAVSWYKKLGFIELEAKQGLTKGFPKAPTPMFISIGTIEKALR